MTAVALLVGQGLLALQAASVAAALPPALILLAATYSFLCALRSESRREKPADTLGRDDL